MKKRFSTSLFALVLALCGIASFFGTFGATSLSAQTTATGPEQDCFGALPITRTLITQQLSYAGVGNNSTELSGLACATGGEVNSSWYRLDVGASGTLAFTINPINGSDDYDFIAFRAPRGTTGAASCQSPTLADLSARIVACNFNPGAGQTGAGTALATAFPQFFANSVTVSAGDVILICVNSKSTATNRAGFTMDFSASTAGVIPVASTPTQPSVSIIAVQTNSAAGCSAPSALNVTFSQPVLRGSIQPTSFVIQSADGSSTINVTQVACVGCPSDNTGSQTYQLTLAAPLTQSGTYRISTSNTSTAVIARDIANTPIVMQPFNLVLSVGTRVPTVQVGSATPRDTRQQGSFCLGQSLTLTAEEASSGAIYQWLREVNGVMTPIQNQTSRTIRMTSRYTGSDPQPDEGVVVEIGSKGLFQVRITDPNGCIRTSSTTEVTSFGGRQADITLSTGQVFPASSGGTRTVRICRNDGVTLSAPTGFRSYLWYFNGAAVDTARARTFFARDLGNYTVETTDENGCVNKPADVVLVPLGSSAPLISGPDVNCPNPTTGRITDRVTLTAAIDPSITSFQWLDSLGRAIPGVTGNTISVLTGRFQLRVSTAEGCTATVEKIVRAGQVPGPIDLVPSGSLGAVPLCPGGFVLLQANAEFPRYAWYRNGVEIPGATQRSYQATVSGSYQVQGFTVEGCPTSLSAPPLSVEPTNIPTPTIRPNGDSLRFCVGSSITLSASSGDNFEWTFNGSRTPFATTREVTVNQAGQYSVRVTFNAANLAGCAVTSSATVIQIERPIVTILNPASDSTFCSGGSLILRATTGYSTYQWSRGGVDIPGATMPTFAVNATGDYSVRVTAGSCSGTSATRRVTEIPSPNIPTIASNSEFLVCPNGSAELFVSNTQTGVTYQWFREGVAIPGATGSRIIITQRGNYLVEARNPNGCTSRPASPSLVDTTSLPVPPTVPRTLVICPNASTTVDAGAGFTAYQWLLNGAVIDGATQRTFVIRAAGRYNVRVSNMRGCINTSADITVTQTAVNVTITPIDFGVRFVARSTPQPQRFQWLLNGVNIPGAIDSVIAPQVCGLYNVRVTDVNNCSDTARTPTLFCPPPPPSSDSCAVNAVCPPNPGTGTGIVRSSNIIAAPGDTVTYRFRLGSYGTLQPGARITANLCFNATLLEPLPPLAAGTISNGVRCIPLTFTLPANLNDALAITSFRAALGNDSVTVLRLQDIQLQPGGAFLTNTSGTFRLTNISYAGGARLIGPAPRMRLSPTAQNPTSDVAVVGYMLENVAANTMNTDITPILPVNITMTDVYGRTVKVSDIQYLLGEVGEIRMNVSDIPPGVYFMVVRSNNATSVQRIHVVR